MSARRELTVAVVAGAAGAVLALVALRQAWVVEVAVRPAPFPAEEVTRTGGDLRPWLPALVWVALAGAGALLATRGVARRLVGAVLVLAGAGTALGAVTALGTAAAGWPLLAAAGGLAAGAAGGLAVLRGRRWPALGARYDRTPTTATGTTSTTATSGPERTPERMWDALDRGEDPTTR